MDWIKGKNERGRNKRGGGTSEYLSMTSDLWLYACLSHSPTRTMSICQCLYFCLSLFEFLSGLLCLCSPSSSLIASSFFLLAPSSSYIPIPSLPLPQTIFVFAKYTSRNPTIKYARQQHTLLNVLTPWHIRTRKCIMFSTKQLLRRQQDTVAVT